VTGIQGAGYRISCSLSLLNKVFFPNFYFLAVNGTLAVTTIASKKMFLKLTSLVACMYHLKNSGQFKKF
jgi:hypothetical protein